MKVLSEQLSDLSAQVKKTEDVVVAAKGKNRDQLNAEQAKLRASTAAASATFHKSEATGKAKDRGGMVE